MEHKVDRREIVASKSFFITREALYNMEKFTYKGQDNSITYKYIISPCLDKLIVHVPEWVAPNLITFCSLLINLFTFALIVFQLGNDFTTPPSRLICLIFAITNFTYYILDNLDGKQARRTNTSSCFGMLFDHGVDAITCCLTSINLCHICSLGNDIKGFALFFCNLSGFWTVMYEEHANGFFNLGSVNGADEGNMVVCFVSLISFIFGPSFWHTHLLGEFKIIDITLICLLFGTIFTLFESIKSMLINKGIDSIKSYIKDSILIFGIIIVFPVLNYILLGTHFKFYMDFVFYITITMCSRIIIQLQIDIISQQPYINNAYTVIWCYGFVIASLVGNSILNGFDYVLMYMYSFVLIVVLANFLFFLFNTTKTILDFLNLEFLTISNRMVVPSNDFQVIEIDTTTK
jgi:phosphatidylglycerophosphate synthase